MLYPICMIAIWLPSVFLGVVANTRDERARDRREDRGARPRWPLKARRSPSNAASELRAQAAGDDVILRLVEGYAPLWLAALLGAAVMAAVMASDSQILALSTMFTEDVFAFYRGTARFGQAVQVQTGRLFVVLLTVVAYLIALEAPQSIFDLATQYAFAGYSSLSPLLVAALFWKGSTKWGALAVDALDRRRGAGRGDAPDGRAGAAAGIGDPHPVDRRRRRHYARGSGDDSARVAAGRPDDDHLSVADGGRFAVDGRGSAE